MNKKFTIGTIILLAILIIRMFVQLLVLVMQNFTEGLSMTVSLLLALLYLISSIGIVRKKQWGAIIAMVIGVIDLLSALALGGQFAIGAGVVDVVILLLAYRQFKIRRTPTITTQL